MGHNAFRSRTTLLFVLGGCVAGCEHAASSMEPETRTSVSPASSPDAGVGDANDDDDAGMMTRLTVKAKPIVAVEPPRVTIAEGELEGRQTGHVRSFIGIPYAKPPVGALRFRAPEPSDAWPALRQATQFGARCAQLASEDAASDSEDCLVLNVWGRDDASEAPVMVFIHGGDHEHGSSSDPLRVAGVGSLYDGQSLAERGVVVVTLNYRLGVLGFLAHQALRAESSSFGNQGLWDQQLALRWVQRNIEVFGGDPSKVTIFGEGSGATDVCWHVASPQSRDLFRSAIVQSGGCTTHQTTRELAQRRAQAFVTQLGCDGPDLLTCLRAKSVGALLEAAPSNAFADASFGPVVDGVFMPMQPRELFDAGSVAKVPLLLGSNSDEGTLLTQGKPEIDTGYDLNAALVRMFSTSAAQILQRYPLSSFGSTPDRYEAAFVRIVGDARVVCPTSDLAQRMAALGSPIYAYDFAVHVSSHGVDLGAVQGAELPYVFGSGSPEFNADAQRLSDRLQTYWTAFATTGNPNDAAESLTWPAWSPAADVRVNFARTTALVDNFRAAECSLWRTSYNSDFVDAQ